MTICIQNTVLFFSLFLCIFSQNYIQDEPCLALKGLYSPVNILNVHFQQFLDSFDPLNENSSVEILDILFDNQTNRFKYIFKITKRDTDPYYIGVLALLQKSGVDNHKQVILKTIQSSDFSDIQTVLFYSKQPQESQLKCPRLKKHFFQELRQQLGLTFIDRYKDYREDTNEPIPSQRLNVNVNSQTMQLKNQQESPKSVQEVYASFDLTKLQNLPDSREFNTTYNALAKELQQNANDAIKTEQLLNQLYALIESYEISN